MHCSAEGVISAQYLGERWWPDEIGGPREFTFDLYYDASLRPDMAFDVFATFAGDGAAHNSWRLRMGDLDISAPFSLLTLWENGGLAINYYDELSGELTVNLEFAGPWRVGALPGETLPPFLFGFIYYNSWSADGIGAGLVFGDALQVTTRQVGRMTPVPEPTTYAAGATVALLAAILWRTRRSRAADRGRSARAMQ